jgi:threonine/homoserine/homoserine lactone efflux protein
MDIAHLAAFNVALAAAFASPGPALLYWIRSTLSGGRAIGIATGCGLATMASTWTLTALLGLEGVLRLFPGAYAAMKLAGAAYLLWLAWQTWRHASQPITPAARPRARAFMGGVLVNLANPKSVFFAAAVLVVIFPPGLSVGDKALIVGNQLLIEVAAYTALAFALTRRAVADRYLRAKPALDRIAATVLGALGLRLLLDR